MAVEALGSAPRAKVAPWNDPVIRGWVFQIVVVGLVGLLAWYLVSNTIETMGAEVRRVESGKVTFPVHRAAADAVPHDHIGWSRASGDDGIVLGTLPHCGKEAEVAPP